jgi:hypothetical protein
MQLLLRQAGGASPSSSSEPPEAELLMAAKTLFALMGGLPLALDQAGAYIERTGCYLVEYLHMYQQDQLRFLHEQENFTRPHAISRILADRRFVGRR